MADKPPIFLISGSPGVGKSSVATALIATTIVAVLCCANGIVVNRNYQVC